MYIIYDFDVVMKKVIGRMGIKQPDFVDEKRLKIRFEQLVRKAKKNSLIDRIALGQPLLEFKR